MEAESAAATGDVKAQAALASIKLWEGAGKGGWRVWPVGKTKFTGHYVYKSPAGQRFTKRGDACDAYAAGEQEDEGEGEGRANMLSAEAAAAAAGDAKARAALADVKLWEGARKAGWHVWPRSKTTNT